MALVIGPFLGRIASPSVLKNLRVDIWIHMPWLSPLFFVNIRIGFSFFGALYFGHSSSIGGFSLVFQGILSSPCSWDILVFLCILAWG